MSSCGWGIELDGIYTFVPVVCDQFSFLWGCVCGDRGCKIDSGIWICRTGCTVFILLELIFSIEKTVCAFPLSPYY